MKNKDCTVVVVSCDKYIDVAGPFITLFRKYWADCPFEIVHVSETLPCDGFDREILTGGGMQWCERLTAALDRISTPYVIMLMDDYYLSDRVDTANVLRRLEQAKKYDAASLRLHPNPPAKELFVPCGGEDAGECDLLEFPKNEAYCVTCQTSIWNREFMRKISAPNKSVWEFERNGSFMLADERRPLLVTRTSEFPFVDAVHKGCWETFGIRVLKDNGIAYDFSKRGLPSLKTRFTEWLKSIVFAIFPWTVIVRVQNFLGIGMKEAGRR